MYENNWNYSVNDDERKKEAIVSAEKINAMFHNKPNWNEKKRVTIDPAAMGMDNLHDLLGVLLMQLIFFMNKNRTVICY